MFPHGWPVAVSRAGDRICSHNQTCPQYEVRVPITDVRAPRAWTPVDRSKPKPPPAPKTRANPVGARARHWQRLMDEGRYPNMSELARAEGVTPAAVSKALGRLRREGGVEREVAAK